MSIHDSLIQYEVDGGYISDVPSHNSNLNSEVSNDLIVSTKALEKQFKEKYNFLKKTYEQRIKQLSSIVQDTCSKLFTDEILNEMKNDKTSSDFIPAHIAEIINIHLEAERENFIHQIIDKNSFLELENNKLKEQGIMISKKNSQLEREYTKLKKIENAFASLNIKHETSEGKFNQYYETAEKELNEARIEISSLQTIERQLKNKVEILVQNLNTKVDECQKLKLMIEEKDKDINYLEQSFEQSSRELAIIEGMDRQEQVLKKELRDQLSYVNNEKNALTNENADLKNQLKTSQEEFLRLKYDYQLKVEEENSNREKISSLMKQVEDMLSQEAEESNAAIQTMHEKMKLFRQKMTAEIQREKRFSGALQEELTKLKQIRDDSSLENKHLLEENSLLRDKLIKEQERSQTLYLETQNQNNLIFEMKSKLSEADNKIKNATEKITEMEKKRHEDLLQMEEKAKYKAERELEAEILNIDRRTSAYRVHYQNELLNVQNQLRHSYSFEGGMGLSTSFTDLHSEIQFKKVIENLVQENAKLKQEHLNELNMIEKKHVMDKNSSIDNYKDRLSEASSYIEKLKSMVRESQELISHQNLTIEYLKQSPSNQSMSHTDTNEKVSSKFSDSVFPKNSFYEPSFTDFKNDPNEETNLSQDMTPSERNQSYFVTEQKQASNFGKLVSESTNQPINPTNSFSEHSQSVPAPSMYSVNYANVINENKSLHGQVIELKQKLAVAQSNGENLTKELSQRSDEYSAHKIELEKQIKDLEFKVNEYKSTVSKLQKPPRVFAVQRYDELQNKTNQLNSTNENLGYEDKVSLNKEEVKISEDAIDPLNSQQNQSIDIERQKDNTHSQDPNSSQNVDEPSLDYLPKKEIPKNTLSQSIKGIATELIDSDAATSSADHAEQCSNTSVLDESKLLEESLYHQMELSEIANQELNFERSRLIDTKKLESKYFKLIVSIQKSYQIHLTKLRNELATIKSKVSEVPNLVELEVKKTLSNLHLKLRNIFDILGRRREKEIMALRMSLTKTHDLEISVLEKRFIEQISKQSKEHSKELEKIQSDLIRKAERALGLTNKSAVNTFHSLLSGPGSSDVLTHQNGFNSQLIVETSHPAVQKKAFESVLKGATEALLDYSIIETSLMNQLLSLAEAHTEPSFAALATSKTLISNQLDIFVIQHKPLQEKENNATRSS